MGSRVQRGETASGPLVFWQDSDADLPKCVANDEGEDDCSLTTSDTKTRSLKPGTVCQIESRLIHFYPFVMSKPVVAKLQFVHLVVQDAESGQSMSATPS